MDSSIVASILTATVTIGVLVGNNTYQRKRERERLLTSKLEELYHSLTVTETILTEPFASIEELKEIGRRQNKSTHHTSMLVRLYFSSLESVTDELGVSSLLLLESAVNLPFEMNEQEFEHHRVSYGSRSHKLLSKIAAVRLKIHEEAESLTERNLSWYY